MACNQELLRAASPSVDAGNLLAMIVKAENMRWVLGSLQHPLGKTIVLSHIPIFEKNRPPTLLTFPQAKVTLF